MAKNKSGVLMAFVCPSCGRQNYFLTITRNTEGKLVLNKYCKQCRELKPHKQTKMPNTKPSVVRK